MSSLKVLIIASSHDELGETGRRTGVWLEEMATPYYLFKASGIAITLASANGGEVPVDPRSQSIIVATQDTKRFLKDDEAMDFLSHSSMLEDVRAADFNMVFLPGGHGALWDLAYNIILKKLLEDFNAEGKPIGAVSNGVACLLSLQTPAGELLLTGKKVTGFSNNEAASAGLTTVLPFLVETKLFLLEALYSKGADYISHVMTDENIITGQNPASSSEVACTMILQAKLRQIPLPAINYQ